jgi:hypothetical protein
MQAVADLSAVVGISAACDALGIARAGFYRQRPRPRLVERPGPSTRQPPARALRDEERAAVLAALHTERFRDRAPAAVQAALQTPNLRGRVVKGVIGSAFEFNRQVDRLVWVNKTYGAVSEDTPRAAPAPYRRWQRSLPR